MQLKFKAFKLYRTILMDIHPNFNYVSINHFKTLREQVFQYNLLLFLNVFSHDQRQFFSNHLVISIKDR
jgi:hypothetical protein